MKLTASDAKKSYVRERDEEIKAKYNSAPSLQKSGKRTANFGKQQSNAVITKIEIPSSIDKQSTGKSSASGDKGGVPQAKRADQTVDSTEVPSYSNAAAKLPSPPTAKRTKNTMKMPQSNVKAKLATKGAKEKPAIPAAKFAKSYTDSMPHGSSTMSGRNKTGEMSTPSSMKNKAPSNRPGNEKKKEAMGLGELPSQKKTTAPSSPSKSMPSGDGAMETPSYSYQVKSSNLRENVQLVLNGKPKSSFGFIHAKVLESIVRKYRSLDIDVNIVKSKNPPAWKKDKEFSKLIVESIDAKFCGAENTARDKRKKAFSRFLNLHDKDNNGFYESDRQFTGTALAAFKKLTETVEQRYKSQLEIFEGTVRIEEEDKTPVDISLIAQARNKKAALLSLKNQIIEDFGFKTKIKHIILDGEKYTGRELRPEHENLKESDRLQRKIKRYYDELVIIDNRIDDAEASDSDFIRRRVLDNKISILKGEIPMWEIPGSPSKFYDREELAALKRILKKDAFSRADNDDSIAFLDR